MLWLDFSIIIFLHQCWCCAHFAYISRLFYFLIFRSSEENVWKLCEQVKKQNPNELSKCYAVFVSNERRTVPLWRQKAGRGEDKLVVWVSIFSYDENRKITMFCLHALNFISAVFIKVLLAWAISMQRTHSSASHLAAQPIWIIYIQKAALDNVSFQPHCHFAICRITNSYTPTPLGPKYVGGCFSSPFIPFDKSPLPHSDMPQWI